MKPIKSVIVAFNYADFPDKKKQKRQEIAIDVLRNSPKNIYPVAYTFQGDKVEIDGIDSRDVLTKNSALTIGNNRALPYVKEIIDLCYNQSYYIADSNKMNYPKVIGLINSDILLGESFYTSIQSDADAFVFSRNDIADVTTEDFLNGKQHIIYGGDTHAGADGFFFNRKWWKKNRGLFPNDLILGETEWDTVYRAIIRKYADVHLENRVLYHVYHDQKWDLISPGAKNNIAIWNKIKEECK